MPIKPEFARRILSEEKAYEFRRTGINRGLSQIIVYASSPEKKILGIADVRSVRVGSPTAIWEETQKKGAGVSRQFFRNYFRGKRQAVCIALGKIHRLPKPVCPKKIRRTFKVPQSYRYVDAAFCDKIRALLNQ